MDASSGPTSRWEHFEHAADIGVRGVGPSVEAAFEQAAVALTAVVTDPRRVAPEETVHVRCEAGSPELLLVEWLNALVFEMATRRMLFARFRVSLEEGALTARAEGEAVDVARHRPAAEVKGATYTSLRVEPTADGGWLAQCVVDV